MAPASRLIVTIDPSSIPSEPHFPVPLSAEAIVGCTRRCPLRRPLLRLLLLLLLLWLLLLLQPRHTLLLLATLLLSRTCMRALVV